MRGATWLVLTILALLFLTAAAHAAANVSASVTFSSVDAACEKPRYTISGTADGTVEDFLGTEFIEIVAHDGTGRIVDSDAILFAFPSVGTPFSAVVEPSGSDPGEVSFFSSRPLTIRIHDATIANTEYALGMPVLFETTIDPANDATECAGLPVDDASLRTIGVTNANVQIFGTSETTVELDDQAPFFQFSVPLGVPEDSVLAAFFSAECANDGANDSSWTSVTIRVNGVDLAPTGGAGDAFCTSNGSAGFDQWGMARTSGAVALPGPGLHFVTVAAQSVGTGTSARLQDTSLVVLVPEPPRALLLWSGIVAVAAPSALRRRR